MVTSRFVRMIHRGDAEFAEKITNVTNFAFGYTFATCSNDQFVRTQSQLTEKERGIGR